MIACLHELSQKWDWRSASASVFVRRLIDIYKLFNWDKLFPLEPERECQAHFARGIPSLASRTGVRTFDFLFLPVLSASLIVLCGLRFFALACPEVLDTGSFLVATAGFAVEESFTRLFCFTFKLGFAFADALL